MRLPSKGAASAVAERARYSCRIAFGDIEADLAAMIDKAVTAISASTPAPDAILGVFVGLAALIRSVSFHDGKLLEQAIIAIGQRNADLVVLWQSLRLPVTPRGAAHCVREILPQRPHPSQGG